MLNCCSQFPIQWFSFNVLQLRLASAFLLSQQPAPNFPKSVKLQQGLHESPVPTNTRTFVTGATQATAPRAALVPPRPSSCRPGSPGCGAASGRPPSHASRRAASPRRGPWPGPRAPGGSFAGRAAAPTQEEAERRRLHAGQATRSLGAGSTSPLENLGRGRRLGAAPRTPAFRKRAPKDLSAARGDHAEPARCGAPDAGGGCLPGRAEVRQSSCRRGNTAGPGAREGLTAVTEAPRGRELEARARGRGGHRAGSLARLAGRTVAAASDPGASLSQAGGRGKEPGVSGIRRAETAAPGSRAARPANKSRRAR